MKQVVPSEVIEPHLREWAAMKDREINEPNGRGAFDVLCARTGISPRTMYGILNREDQYRNIDFNTADRLLVAMGKWELWWDELEEHYWPNGEVPPDKRKPIKCLNPDCPDGGWFSTQVFETAGCAVGEQFGRSLYCSESCKNTVSRRKYDRSRKGKAVRKARDRANRERRAAYMREYRARKRAEAVAA